MCIRHKTFPLFFFQKLTGEDLTYTMLLGKPYLPTYKFAEQCFQESNGPSTVENVYVVG